MKLIKSGSQEDLMTKTTMYFMDLETLDNDDDPIRITLTVRTDKYSILGHTISPIYSNVRFTKSQILELLKKTFPMCCQNITVNLLQETVSPRPYFLTKEQVIQNLVRKNIELLLKNMELVFNGDRQYTAQIVDEDKLSDCIVEIFEEYKNIS